MQVLRQLDRPDLAPEQPRALQGDQSSMLQPAQLVDGVLDLRAVVHRDGDQRQVLGERQQRIGAQVVLQTEPGRAAQQNTGGDLPAAEQLQLGVGEKPASDSLSLAEVGCQLQAVLVQSAPPNARPAAAATSPAARLTARLVAAPRS